MACSEVKGKKRIVKKTNAKTKLTCIQLHFWYNTTPQNYVPGKFRFTWPSAQEIGYPLEEFYRTQWIGLPKHLPKLWFTCLLLCPYLNLPVSILKAEELYLINCRTNLVLNVYFLKKAVAIAKSQYRIEWLFVFTFFSP